MSATHSKPTQSVESKSDAQQEIAELNIKLEELQHQLMLAQKMSSIGELASSMTHEFNNILTTVINYAKLGLRQRDPVARDKAFDKILNAGQRAAKITTGLLSYARADAKRRDAHSLKRLLSDVLVLVEKDLKVHRIDLQLRLDSDPYVHANACQIQQVLLNLIVNARQAMQDGKSLFITIQTSEDDRSAELLIRDQGQGIPKDVLPHIFERFYTTKTAERDGTGGTGLGLALCREVIEDHGGRIRVKTAVGHGTEFTLLLPRVEKPSFDADVVQEKAGSAEKPRESNVA